MTRRPEEGYQVRSRLQARPSVRGRIAAALVGIAVIGWAAATLTSERPVTSDATGPPTPRISLRPGETARPTIPPAIEVRPGAPVLLLPLVLRGQSAPGLGDRASLAWLAPGLGTIRSEPDPSWAQWLFFRDNGSVRCICIEPAGNSQGSGVLHVMDWDAGGGALRDWFVDWAVPDRDAPALFDAALDPRGEGVTLATATHAVGGWTVRVDRVESGQVVARAAVGTILDSDVGESRISEVRVWISPDGGHARVRLGTTRNHLIQPEGPAASFTWLVPIVEGAPGKADAIPAAEDDRDGAQCGKEGWATATDFVTLCFAFDSDAGQPSTTIDVQSLDGSASRQVIPAVVSFGFEPAGWLMDATASILYLYDGLSTRIFRVEVPSLEVTERELPRPAAGGGFDPEAARPEPEPVDTLWQSGAPASSLWSSSIVGSPDGSLLYVAGNPPPSVEFESQFSSTGIWVLDAATLAVVDHWQPEAEYLWLGLTPDGRYVMAFGSPSSAEIQAHGNYGPLLTFHDAASGAAVLIIRSVVTQLGSEPYFPLQGPAL
jgi:hypothetical protein